MAKSQIVEQIESIIGKELELAPIYPDVLTGLMVVKKGIAKYAMEGKKLIGLNLVGINLKEEQWDKVIALPNMDNLKGLNLSSNSFRSITLTEKCSNLEQLEIGDNEQLTQITLPSKLPKLKRLILRDNKIEVLTLPRNLSALKFLDVSRNEMTSIDFQENLPKVAYIDLSGNRLTTFSIPTIFPNLTYLNIDGSEPTNIPPEIYKEKKNCWDDLSSYLRAEIHSGVILNTEAKLVFFGNGRVGKTTLSHQLRTGEFDETIEVTHGILVNEWLIEQENFPESFLAKIEATIANYKREKGKELSIPNNILLNVWDFGGQEYFHATHRLFLSNNIFYLVLWETATNQQDEEEGNYPYDYWQANIDHYSEENTTLLVQNKEMGGAITNHNILKYKIAERNDTDTRRYDLDVEDLKKGIFEQLVNLEYLATPIAKIYDDIRKEIKQVKENTPYLSFSQYVELCKELDTTENQIMSNEQDIASLTRFLHETGSIICYKYKEDKTSSLLNDYVFIDPKWVTTTIYQILDEKTKTNYGEFNQDHIIEVLKKENNVIEDVDLWAELMSEFELIFQKDTKEKTYIAPQYLSKKCRDLATKKAMDRLLEELPYQLVIHYPDFLSRSTISRFICKYGDLARDFYWKYGIVVFKKNEKALVLCDYSQQQIIIRTSDCFSTLAIELFETLRVLDNSPKLEVIVSKSDNSDTLIGPVNIVKLEEQIQKGRKYIEWSNAEYELKYFKPIFNQSPIAISESKVSIRKEVLPQENFISKPIYFSYAWRDEQNPNREVLVDSMYDTLINSRFDIRRDKNNCKHGEYLDEYMKEIGKGELIVVFLSEKYFRSEYCMTELFLIAERVDWNKEEFKDRILPIQVEKMDYSDFAKQVELFQYWAKKKEEKQQQVRQLESMNFRVDNEQLEELDRIINIANKLSTLMTRIKNLNRGSISLYQRNDFASIKQILLQRLGETSTFQEESNGLQIFSDKMVNFLQQQLDFKQSAKKTINVSANSINTQKDLEQIEKEKLREHATLLIEKISRLQTALILETDAGRQFKYETDIKKLEKQLQEVKEKLNN